mgnify:FL=1
MLAEPWSTVLFLIVIPLLVQVAKLVAEKVGKPLPVIALQAIAAALSAVFVYFNGGFLGLAIPVYDGDFAGFVNDALVLLVAAWGPVELIYRLAWKAIYDGVGLS